MKTKKAYEAPAMRRIGSFRKVTGLLVMGVPDALAHGNIL